VHQHLQLRKGNVVSGHIAFDCVVTQLCSLTTELHGVCARDYAGQGKLDVELVTSYVPDRRVEREAGSKASGSRVDVFDKGSQPDASAVAPTSRAGDWRRHDLKAMHVVTSVSEVFSASVHLELFKKGDKAKGRAAAIGTAVVPVVKTGLQVRS
jgi:hypothetical protein